MRAKRYFITGTDTHVGKTTVALGLLTALRTRNLATVALKPLAAGCEARAGNYYNTDALALQKAASSYLPYAAVNPIALPLATAPHIAAAAQATTLSVQQLVQACAPALAVPAAIYVIEGAGGWFVPLNLHETLADLVSALACKVILVVGMRLGCLNHALLTCHAIASAGLSLSGWVANCAEPDMSYLRENITTLTTLIAAPLLGVVPFGGCAAHALKLDLLL